MLCMGRRHTRSCLRTCRQQRAVGGRHRASSIPRPSSRRHHRRRRHPHPSSRLATSRCGRTGCLNRDPKLRACCTRGWRSRGRCVRGDALHLATCDLSGAHCTNHMASLSLPSLAHCRRKSGPSRKLARSSSRMSVRERGIFTTGPPAISSSPPWSCELPITSPLPCCCCAHSVPSDSEQGTGRSSATGLTPNFALVLQRRW